MIGWKCRFVSLGERSEMTAIARRGDKTKTKEILPEIRGVLICWKERSVEKPPNSLRSLMKKKVMRVPSQRSPKE